jgi:glyoxylase-like metal-dependent hydrolase (beta-lactamase superfamily II)
MLKRFAGLAAGWLALTGMQAPPAAQPQAQISLWRLDCGEFLIKQYGAFFSDTFQYPEGAKAITDSCYLIRHGNRYMLWDTGLPGEMAGQTVDTPAQTLSLRRRIVDQLADIGVKPEQIEIIGISHWHLDHLGQAAEFPKAKLVMGKGDLEVLRKGPAGGFLQPDRLAPWLKGKAPLVEAESDIDIFHDGRVVMLDMPGHTPGHFSLLVRLASGPVLLSGDLYHFTEQVKNRGVPPFNHDRADTLASIDRYEAIARNLKAVTIIQHEPADIGRLPAFPKAAQ